MTIVHRLLTVPFRLYYIIRFLTVCSVHNSMLLALKNTALTSPVACVKSTSNEYLEHLIGQMHGPDTVLKPGSIPMLHSIWSHLTKTEVDG